MKYTFDDFKNDFNNDDVCLDFIFKNKFGHLSDFNKYHRIKGRRSYFNSLTSKQVYPTAGTILHNSRTSLTKWFYAIFLFSQSKNGVSAKELERHLGVTYKTAWRIGHLIRKLMEQDDIILKGVVEADETYVGGKEKNKHASKKIKNASGRSLKGKVPVFGMVERKGMLVVRSLKNVQRKTVMKNIKKNIAKGSHLMTDEYNVYDTLKGEGYDHDFVKHAEKEYVRGDCHTNNIEGFWGQFKRSVDGTHHMVSEKYLQKYLDEFTFKYNNRNSEKHLFMILLNRITHTSYKSG